jgi:23S rRNA (guanine2535-N1)-methyltransferase
LKYRFVQTREDYSDLAAGKVFQSLPGFTPFPVRLASEIFQRCLALRQSPANVLYDPCCGSGYLLAVLAYLHGDAVKVVVGSDINPEAIQLAERNLALLTLHGLDTRLRQIEAMLASFGKDSHAEALASGRRMRQRLLRRPNPVETRLFRADATNKSMIADGLKPLKADVVIADVPYGQHSSWTFSSTPGKLEGNPTIAMLDALQAALSEHAVVAIASAKAQKVVHPAYRRVGHFPVGKRRVVFLTPSHAVNSFR